jgi:hypothetical protein
VRRCPKPTRLIVQASSAWLDAGVRLHDARDQLSTRAMTSTPPESWTTCSTDAASDVERIEHAWPMRLYVGRARHEATCSTSGRWPTWAACSTRGRARRCRATLDDEHAAAGGHASDALDDGADTRLWRQADDEAAPRTWVTRATRGAQHVAPDTLDGGEGTASSSPLDTRRTAARCIPFAHSSRRPIPELPLVR